MLSNLRELDKHYSLVVVCSLSVIIGLLLIAEQYFLGLFTAVFSFSLLLYLHWQIEFYQAAEESPEREKRIYSSEDLPQLSIMSFLAKRPFLDFKSQNKNRTNLNSSNNSRLQTQEQNNSFPSSSDVFSNVSVDQELPRFGSPSISRRQSFRTSMHSPLGNISKSSSSSSKLSRRASFTYGFNSGLSSIGGSPVSPLTRPTLPRVQRMAERDINSSYLLSPTRTTMSPNKYPTHQSKYGSAGILPSVKLHRPERHILTDINRPSPTRPVTVKVAPPDVLKPPTPLVLPLEDKIDSGKKSIDSDAVLTALREKRKRPQVEDSAHTPTEQLNKRRRHVSKTPTRDTNLPPELSQNHAAKTPDCSKRVATKRPVSNGLCESVEQKGINSKRTKVQYTVNALEASYASSKGMLERQQTNRRSGSVEYSPRELNTRRVTRSKSRERTVGRSVDLSGNLQNQSYHQNIEINGNTPRLNLDRDVIMTPNVSTPVKNGPDTPLIDDNFTERELRKELGKKKPQMFTLKRGNTKLRSTPIYSGTPSSLENIPTLRYSHTVEDYEKDRQEDISRIQQMLDDVDEAHKAKLDKSKDTSQDKGTSSTSSVLTITTPLTSTSKIEISGTSTITTNTSSKITPASVASSLGNIKAYTTDSSPAINPSGTGIQTSTTTSTRSLALGATISIGNNGSSQIGASTCTNFATPTVSISTAFTNKDPPPPYVISSASSQPTTSSTALFGNSNTLKNTQPSAASCLSVVGKGTSTGMHGLNPHMEKEVKTQEKHTPQFKPAFQLSGANTNTSTASLLQSGQKTNAPVVSKTIGGFSFPATTSAGQGINKQSNPVSVPVISSSSVQRSAGTQPFGATTSGNPSDNVSFSFGKPAESKPAHEKHLSYGDNQTKSSSASITFGHTATVTNSAPTSFSQQPTALSNPNPTSATFNFGQPGTATKTVSFGGNSDSTKTLTSGQSATANISSPFGQNATANISSPFGQNATASIASPFGQSATANISSPFGNSSAIFGQNAPNVSLNSGPSTTFNFGQTSNNAGFGQNTNTSTSTSGFGNNMAGNKQGSFGTSTTANAQGSFGQSSSKDFAQSNPSTNVPSIFGQTSNAIFGQGTPNQSSNTPFGKTDSTKNTTAPSIFGQSTNTKMSTSQTPVQTESSNVFQFGQPLEKSEPPKTTSVFSFGQTGNTTSKTSSSSGVFGATSSAQPSSIFGATQTSQKTGVGALNTSSTGGFNSNQTQAGANFGQSGQSTFGAGSFGNTAPSQSQQKKGFDFSAATGGNSSFSFGNNPSQPLNQGNNPSQPFNQGNNPSQPFNQGNNPSQPPNQGFSFTSGQGSFGSSQPAPAFGTPGASVPGNFGTPGQAASPGMFSVGSGSTAAKPRSRSRRPPRR